MGIIEKITGRFRRARGDFETIDESAVGGMSRLAVGPRTVAEMAAPVSGSANPVEITIAFTGG